MEPSGRLSITSNSWVNGDPPTGATAAAGGKLVDQRLRHFARGGGKDHAVERRLFRPAAIPVALPHRDVAVAELLQQRAADCASSGTISMV